MATYKRMSHDLKKKSFKKAGWLPTNKERNTANRRNLLLNGAYRGMEKIKA